MQLASNPQDPSDAEYQAGLERLRASRERCREVFRVAMKSARSGPSRLPSMTS